MRYIYIVSLVFISCFAFSGFFPRNKELKTGAVQIRFSTEVENKPLRFNTYYQNSMGESFNVALLKYYVSNIKLRKNDGTEILIPDSYYLIDAEYGNTIKVKNVPEGSYDRISFVLGVDSAKTKRGGYVGDLDPIKGMFWNTWGTYINFMLNGYAKSADQTQAIEYHIGGFEKPNSTLQSVTIDFTGSTLEVSESGSPTVSLALDILKFFKSTNTISIAKTPVISEMGDSAKIASENFRQMFHFKQIIK